MRKIDLFKKEKSIYKKFTINGEPLTTEFQELIKKNRRLLLDNQVPINKVHFVFLPTFNYDINKNIVNPKYMVLMPVSLSTGKFTKDVKISVDKPEHLATITVTDYRVDDNYGFIKNILKNSKKGVVIYICDDEYLNFNGDTHGVDTDVLRLAILDEEIEIYESNIII